MMRSLLLKSTLVSVLLIVFTNLSKAVDTRQGQFGSGDSKENRRSGFAHQWLQAFTGYGKGEEGREAAGANKQPHENTSASVEPGRKLADQENQSVSLMTCPVHLMSFLS